MYLKKNGAVREVLLCAEAVEKIEAVLEAGKAEELAEVKKAGVDEGAASVVTPGASCKVLARMGHKKMVACEMGGKIVTVRVQDNVNFRRGMMIFGKLHQVNATTWDYLGRMPRRPGCW